MNFNTMFLDKCLTFLMITLVIKSKFSTAHVIRCPEYQTHFEKILGFRPPSSSPLSAQYGTPYESKTIYTSQHQVPSVINMQCMEICRKDIDCDSYVLNFNKSECYGYTSNERRLMNFNLMRLDDEELIEDINVVYFVKICLNIPSTCKSALWPLLRIPGSSLIGRGYLTVNKLVTRRECIERCMFETSFKCRSVSFQISQRNNLIRQGFFNILNKFVMGQCILSKDDKNTEPDSFRVAPITEEYIENQCNLATNEEGHFLDDLCSYEHYPESSLVYAESEYDGLTDRQCQEKCYTEKRYFCKGVTFQKTIKVESSKCYIHSEDVVSLGPRAVVPVVGSYYMKRVQCLNLTVRCTHSDMVINFHPKQFFIGQIYAEKHSDECGVSGSNLGPTILKLPIGTPTKEARCGIIRAFDYETPNRTLIFTYIIIQNNPQVQMQSDRYIKVGCISSYNRTSANGVPDYIALETSVEFNSQKDYDGSGSLVIDNGGDIPKLNVWILDAVDNMPIREAKIGQLLKFVISMESHYENYDLRAINLTANSDSDKIELIGSTGCPNNVAIFPAMQKEITNSSRMLTTKFRAFKFAASSVLRFSVKIQFCYKMCRPVNCGYGIVSYGRKKREVEMFQKIVTSGVSPVVFPDQIKQATTVGPSYFPDTEPVPTEPPVPLNPVVFPGPVNEKYVSEQEPPQDSRPGIRIDTFGNPQGVQQYFGAIKEDNDVNENKSRSSIDVVTVPLVIMLSIVEKDQDINGTDRFVIGDDDQLLVAGLASNGGFCMDQSLLIAILIFWIIFQIIILLGCCILVRRYRKLTSLEDDQSSIDNHGYYPDSLENRHVRWADQRVCLPGEEFLHQI